MAPLTPRPWAYVSGDAFKLCGGVMLGWCIRRCGSGEGRRLGALSPTEQRQQMKTARHVRSWRKLTFDHRRDILVLTPSGH
jgi:hypothetical protein